MLHPKKLTPGLFGCCGHSGAEPPVMVFQIAQPARRLITQDPQPPHFRFGCHSPEEKRWFQATVAPLRGDTVDGAVIMHVNITERRLAEDAARVREERYRSLVTAIGHLVWSPGAGGHGAEEPASLCSFSGRTLGDLMGTGWQETVHADDRAKIAERWNEAVAGEDVFAVEYRALVPGGGYRLFQLRAVPVSEEDGSIREWVGARADVTERRRLEEQSRQAAKMEVVGQLGGHPTSSAAALTSSRDRASRLFRVGKP